MNDRHQERGVGDPPEDGEEDIGPGLTSAMNGPAGRHLTVEVQRGEREFVLRVAGELDLDTVALLSDELSRVEDGPERLILDFSDVVFMDSTGLRVVLEGHERSTQVGRQLSLRGITPQVRRVLEMTGTLTVLVEPEP